MTFYPGLWKKDNLHLNDSGYKKWAQWIREIVIPNKVNDHFYFFRGCTFKKLLKLHIWTHISGKTGHMASRVGETVRRVKSQ